MAKKHYVVWGRVGLIYFSWLLIVLFTSLIIAYEGTSSFNWPAIGCGILFVLLAVYTYVNSYWSKDTLKLPFRAKRALKRAPKRTCRWRRFCVYEVQGLEPQKYYLLRIEK